MTQQPVWKLVASLGDVNPVEYGGLLVFVDTTGVYGPEVEVYEPNEEDDTVTVSRIMLETGSDEWWRKELQSVADTCGQTVLDYEEDLTSGDPTRIAMVYRDLVYYFGTFEFDQYPLVLNQAQAKQRFENYHLDN